MKNRYLIVILLLLIGSCDLFVDEAQPPGIALYKTRGDYYKLVNIGMKGDKIYMLPSYYNPHYKSILNMEVTNNDTIYTGRCGLPNGYVLDAAGGLKVVFLNMTFKEYLNRQIINAQKQPGDIISEDTLRKYILDKDPYLEFYQNKTSVKRLKLSDSLEIREIILNGEIHQYFDKLK